MKKGLITVVSLFYAISGFCQAKALYLRSKETVKFQTWDTIYAIKAIGNSVILKDRSGKEYICELDKKGREFDSPIEIYNGSYHIHGNPGVGACHHGILMMDNSMKLFFKDNAKLRSNHFDHGSHYSHYSSKL